MEQAIKILIYIHAFLGGLGLIAGITSIAVKKGSTIHMTSGTVFSYSMLSSSLISLVIARMPHHENLFLFLIGVFTIYMVLAGNRALTLRSKTKSKADIVDKSISGLMFLTSVGMLIIGIAGMMQKNNNSVLFLFFGGIGFFLTLNDFKTFRTFTTKNNAWLKSHIGRMIGALIASITAFMVAGLNIGTVFVWMLPTILGTGYIIYWNRKLKGVKMEAG